MTASGFTDIQRFVETALGDKEGPRFDLLVTIVGANSVDRILAVDGQSRAELVIALSDEVKVIPDAHSPPAQERQGGPDVVVMNLMTTRGMDERPVGNDKHRGDDLPPEFDPLSKMVRNHGAAGMKKKNADSP